MHFSWIQSWMVGFKLLLDLLYPVYIECVGFYGIDCRLSCPADWYGPLCNALQMRPETSLLDVCVWTIRLWSVSLHHLWYTKTKIYSVTWLKLDK